MSADKFREQAKRLEEVAKKLIERVRKTPERADGQLDLLREVTWELGNLLTFCSCGLRLTNFAIGGGSPYTCRCGRRYEVSIDVNRIADRLDELETENKQLLEGIAKLGDR